MAKKPKIEVDEDLMRQMIAGQAPLTSKGRPANPRRRTGRYSRCAPGDPGCRRTIAILGRRV